MQRAGFEAETHGSAIWVLVNGQVVVWCGLSSSRLRLADQAGGNGAWSERARMGCVSGAYRPVLLGLGLEAQGKGQGQG